MKFLWSLLGLFLMTLSPAFSQNIKTLKWQKRILLVFEPAGQDSLFAAQKSVERNHRTAFSERDVVVVKATDAQLYRQFGVKNRQKTVFLIGKDGQPKVQRNRVLSVEELSSIIDAMPMRRDEMRRQDKN